jgi:hypothetical protein
MSLDFHLVVQDTTDTDEVAPDHSVEQQVPRLGYGTERDRGTIPTMAKMVAAYAGPKLRPINASPRSGSAATSRKPVTSNAS